MSHPTRYDITKMRMINLMYTNGKKILSSLWETCKLGNRGNLVKLVSRLITVWHCNS